MRDKVMQMAKTLDWKPFELTGFLSQQDSKYTRYNFILRRLSGFDKKYSLSVCREDYHTVMFETTGDDVDDLHATLNQKEIDAVNELKARHLSDLEAFIDEKLGFIEE